MKNNRLNAKAALLLILALLLLFCVSSCSPDAQDGNTPDAGTAESARTAATATRTATEAESSAPAPTESAPTESSPISEPSETDSLPETLDPADLAGPSPDDGFVQSEEEGWGDLVPIGD